MADNEANTRARRNRFIGDFFEEVPENIEVAELISKSLKHFDKLFQDEKTNAPVFGKAWARAEEQYKTIFENFGEPQQKFMTETLPKKVPEELKKNAHYLPIAVVVCTSYPNGFFAKFNNKTRQLFSGEIKWQSFRFKSFFILLTFALECLPSRPRKAMNKFIFRGSNIEAPPEEGKVFCLNHFGSFTTRRGLALGNQGTKEENEDAAEVKETPKFLVRMTLDSELNALGVRHLSCFEPQKMEVLVAPQQKLQVVKLVKNESKGFTVILVRPVK